MVINEPTPPIFLKPEDENEISIFSSTQIAENMIERDEVEANFWTICDSRGRLLKAIVKSNHVVIRMEDPEPQFAQELEGLLREFLTRKGDLAIDNLQIKLEDMVRLCAKYADDFPRSELQVLKIIIRRIYSFIFKRV